MGKIVWLASYPKSGNTWVRAFLHHYITHADAPLSINALADFSAVECAAAFFHAPGERISTQEAQKRRPEVHARLTRLHEDLLFVKTHNANLAVHGVPLCTPSQSAGAVYVLRDPRDVAVSYSAFTGRGVDEMIDFMANPRAANAADGAQVFELLSSWSGHVESWAGDKKTCVVRYEDLLAAPETYFGRIVRFLGGAAAPERLRRAIAFSDFKELAAQEKRDGYKAGGSNAAFFRAGVAGAWRTTLSAAQAKRIERAHGEAMRKAGYL